LAQLVSVFVLALTTVVVFLVWSWLMVLWAGTHAGPLRMIGLMGYFVSTVWSFVWLLRKGRGRSVRRFVTACCFVLAGHFVLWLIWHSQNVRVDWSF